MKCFGSPDSASGSELVSWLVDEEGVEEGEGRRILAELLDKKLIVAVTENAGEDALLSSRYK